MDSSTESSISDGGDESGQVVGNSIAPNSQQKSSLPVDGSDNNQNGQRQHQIANLFPCCTVLFADIAGFTAWSISREPQEVFLVLRTVYQAFDVIAKRRRVFKAESFGDSYVTVTGLLDPEAQHAMIMARFAWECKIKMNELTRQLEATLGPDTGGLAMRFGLHSGPVRAAVFQGDEVHLELFGDTVNTASHMESLGARDKIQISTATADLLIAEGKGYWVEPREDLIEANGEGFIRTYWLNLAKKAPTMASSQSNSGGGEISSGVLSGGSLDNRISAEAMTKQNRWCDWVTELLLGYMKNILAKRNALGIRESSSNVEYTMPEGYTYLDEAKDVINMPKCDIEATGKEFDHSEVEITSEVSEQLRQYVTAIAAKYNDYPFHNFEHACHVTMSVDKLLKRIVIPDLDGEDSDHIEKSEFVFQLHAYTQAINSDPLALFAIVFSALIHDVDHRGVPNKQLVNEEQEMANKFRNRSVAEQNSIDVSWKLLMSEQFSALRQQLFGNQNELMRFRQLIINVVLATDISDKELNDRRQARWEKAFSSDIDSQDNADLKATIVIEHIIQAANLNHTMQHWQIYLKWNKQLIQEMYNAYHSGRLEEDPTSFWYEGELFFFDNYIIPLAAKFQECNVFGVTSAEYLNYAVWNRAKWEEYGLKMVEEVLNVDTTKN